MNHALGNIALGMLLGYAFAREVSRRKHDASDHHAERAADSAGASGSADASAAPGPGLGALYPGGTAAAHPAR